MKISDDVQGVLQAAYLHAREHNHEYITPEHVLYALMFFDVPRDILETHEWLFKEPERAQSIAEKGLELIMRAHSVSARGRQLCESFNRIMTGRFYGAYWSGGKLCFRESSGNSNL